MIIKTSSLKTQKYYMIKVTVSLLLTKKLKVNINKQNNLII